MKYKESQDNFEMLMQEQRCRAALKMIDVPDEVVWMFRGPILFQLAHLCCVIDQPMHWRDALRWIYDHKGEIFEHARKVEIERRKDLTASAGTNAEANGHDVESGDKARPTRLG